MYGSIKKHYNQMTYNEIRFIKSIIKTCRKHKFSSHVRERMKEKNISEYEIYHVFKGYKIIEYHKKGRENRVLLRSSEPLNGYNICISMDLDSGKIITAYKNFETDFHATLDEERYNKYIKVIELIKQKRII